MVQKSFKSNLPCPAMYSITPLSRAGGLTPIAVAVAGPNNADRLKRLRCFDVKADEA